MAILLVYFLTLIIALSFILSYDKTGINVYLNQLVGNPIGDAFFFYITYFGDGMVAAFLLAIILVYNVRLGIYAILSFLTSSMIATILKRVFFDDVNRPFYVYQWLEKDHPIKYVEGVDLYIMNSFPSGHATQAFAIGMCLIFSFKNQWLKFFVLLIALLTSFSRVYLSQHWLVDITAGSLIGFTCSIIFYYLLIYHNKFERLNRSLTSFNSA